MSVGCAACLVANENVSYSRVITDIQTLSFEREKIRTNRSNLPAEVATQ